MSTSTPAIVPSNTALLVMDYQRGIVGRMPDADSLLARASRALALGREHGLTVCYVRVAFRADELAAVPETNKAFAALAAGAQIGDDAPETAIHEDVAPRPEDIVVRKTRVGAFSTTDLDEQLRGSGIDTLILAGISTSGVVLSTVRDAADKDYRLYVLADACGDTDATVHATLTERVFPRQAYVVATDELAELLPRDPRY